VDNSRATARLSLRFNLTEVTTATLAVSTSRLKEVGAAADRTNSLSFGLDHALPDGALTFDATLSRLSGGNRTSLQFGRSLDLPNGQLAASLGLSTREVGGGPDLIGSLDWSHELPRGNFTLGLKRAITGDARDSETEVSLLALGLTQDLTPRIALTTNLSLQSSRDTSSGILTKSTNLSANLRYALTPDWNMNFSATHRIRNQGGAGNPNSSTVYLSLSRQFEYRP
jgi:hypothetical protein